jgi:sec-independent protein translocase protein TatA
MNIFGLGTPEILLIVFLLLLFFGKDKLPGLVRSIGESLRELKTSFTGTPEKKETPVASEEKDVEKQ